MLRSSGVWREKGLVAAVWRLYGTNPEDAIRGSISVTLSLSLKFIKFISLTIGIIVQGLHGSKPIETPDANLER